MKDIIEKPKRIPNPKGRPVGTKTRFKIDVAEICVKHNVNPAEAIVLLLKETEDPEFKLRCASELLPYCASKFKSIEISTGEGAQFRLNIIQSSTENINES